MYRQHLYTIFPAQSAMRKFDLCLRRNQLSTACRKQAAETLDWFWRASERQDHCQVLRIELFCELSVTSNDLFRFIKGTIICSLFVSYRKFQGPSLFMLSLHAVVKMTSAPSRDSRTDYSRRPEGNQQLCFQMYIEEDLELANATFWTPYMFVCK